MAQYQFPSDALDKVRERTNEYVDLLNSEKYLHLQVESITRKQGVQSEMRTTNIYINQEIVVVKSHEMEYFMDDSLMLIVNHKEKKIFAKNIIGQDMATGYVNSLAESMDSVLFYTESVTYTERPNRNTFFQVKIAPDNYSLFDNLMYQNIYYSEGSVLPDSTVKVFYDEVSFEEVTHTKLVSKSIPKELRLSRAQDYVFDKNYYPYPKFNKYTLQEL